MSSVVSSTETSSSNSCVNRLTQLALLTKHKHLMGNLPAPIRSKLFNRYGNEHYQACVCSMQGYRANMEDSHLVHLSFTSHSQYSLFAIFDGHNGRKAAQHLSRNLIHKLDALPTLSDNKQIQQLILSMDMQFCQSQHGQSGSTVVFAIVKPTQNNTTTTTNNNNEVALHQQGSNNSLQSNKSNASTVSISDNNINDNDNSQYEIRVFWAGDSRALLIRDDNIHKFKELTCDHRPNNPNEKIRIETANGIIINNRVDSKLAVSRAFGDCNLKNDKALTWEKQRVTSLTECNTIIANKNDKLFLFCDGLVEYLNNKQLIQMLYQHLNKYEDPVYGLGYLFDEILEGGSRDNMSAIIINIGNNATDYGTNDRHKTFLPGPLYMTRNDKKYVEAYLRNAKDFGHSDTPKLRRAAYREDLKFLRKYGIRGLSLQQQQYGKTANNIISEIEQVIRDIDIKANETQHIREMKQQTNGSTEIIGSTEDIESRDTSKNNNNNNNEVTPPLSECDDDEKDQADQDDDLNLTFNTFNNNINSTQLKLAMEKSLTHMSAPLKRNNSMVVTPSQSPTDNKNSNSDSNSNSHKKRTFTDMNNMNEKDMNMNVNNDNQNGNGNDNEKNVDICTDNIKYSASKRRKSNIGDAVKIHTEHSNNNNNNNSEIQNNDIKSKIDIE